MAVENSRHWDVYWVFSTCFWMNRNIWKMFKALIALVSVSLYFKAWVWILAGEIFVRWRVSDYLLYFWRMLSESGLYLVQYTTIKLPVNIPENITDNFRHIPFLKTFLHTLMSLDLLNKAIETSVSTRVEFEFEEFIVIGKFLQICQWFIPLLKYPQYFILILLIEFLNSSELFHKFLFILY